ncbi:MAG: hypothetical protein ABSF14_17380 [Terriglobia bacterium]
MRLSIELGIAMLGGAAAARAGVWIWKTARLWRRKDPAELERLRRLAVNARGRIIAGKILELLDPAPDGPAGPVLLYEYEVAGVTYQAAQDVSPLPEVAAAAPFLPGQTASIKYDPRQPTNSILACEGWCGIPDLTRGTNPSSQPREPSPEASAKG